MDLIFESGFVANSTIHTICGYIIAAGQITHRIPVIRNWNFLFCWLKSMVTSRIFQSRSFFQFLTLPDEGRDLLEVILPITMIRKLSLIFLLIVWWYSLYLHDVINFSNLTVQKIRFLMGGRSQLEAKCIECFRYFSSVLMGSIFIL